MHRVEIPRGIGAELKGKLNAKGCTEWPNRIWKLSYGSTGAVNCR